MGVWFMFINVYGTQTQTPTQTRTQDISIQYVPRDEILLD